MLVSGQRQTAPLQMPVRLGREAVVKARLASLLASLGEIPGYQAQPSRAAGTGAGLVPSNLLDQLCGDLACVIHDKLLPPGTASRYFGPIEHLVIAPRGVVVVGPLWAAEQGLAGPTAASMTGRGEGSAVRQALRRAGAVRDWLKTTTWPEAPVFAAACSGSALALLASPPVVIGDLWVGPASRLPAWLSAPAQLSPEMQAALADFAQMLPDA